jgi:transmembrane sensor
MNVRDEEVRTLIAHQAGDWFVAHREGNLSAGERQAFHEWLLASPVHVEEYLGVASIARTLPAAADDPEYPLDAILARVGNAAASNVRPLLDDRSTPHTAPTSGSARRYRWHLAAAALLAAVVGALLWRSIDRPVPQSYATGHGQRQTLRLADNSERRSRSATVAPNVWCRSTADRPFLSSHMIRADSSGLLQGRSKLLLLVRNSTCTGRVIRQL